MISADTIRKRWQEIRQARIGPIVAMCKQRGLVCDVDTVEGTVSIEVPYRASNGGRATMWHDVRTMQEAHDVIRNSRN